VVGHCRVIPQRLRRSHAAETPASRRRRDATASAP
jgi:hypothetical protein